MELDDITHAARDVAFIAVGLGLIGFQRAQVRRRELQVQLDRAAQTAREFTEQVGGRLVPR